MKRREFLQSGVACSLLPLSALKSPSVSSCESSSSGPGHPSRSSSSSKSSASQYPLSGCKQDEHNEHDWTLIDYELKNNEFWMTWCGHKCIATQLSLKEIPKWIRAIPENRRFSKHDNYFRVVRILDPDFYYFVMRDASYGDYELMNLNGRLIGGVNDWERVCHNCGMTVEKYYMLYAMEYKLGQGLNKEITIAVNSR